MKKIYKLNFILISVFCLFLIAGCKKTQPNEDLTSDEKIECKLHLIIEGKQTSFTFEKNTIINLEEFEPTSNDESFDHFDGWYLDEEFKVKFIKKEFQITRDWTLYALMVYNEKNDNNQNLTDFIPKTFDTVEDIKEFFESVEYANRRILRKDSFSGLFINEELLEDEIFYDKYSFDIKEESLDTYNSLNDYTYLALIKDELNNFEYEKVVIENLSLDFYKIKITDNGATSIVEINFKENYLKISLPGEILEFKTIEAESDFKNSIEKMVDLINKYESTNIKFHDYGISDNLISIPGEMKKEKCIVAVIYDNYYTKKDFEKIETFLSLEKNTGFKVYFYEPNYIGYPYEYVFVENYEVIFASETFNYYDELYSQVQEYLHFSSSEGNNGGWGNGSSGESNGDNVSDSNGNNSSGGSSSEGWSDSTSDDSSNSVPIINMYEIQENSLSLDYLDFSNKTTYYNVSYEEKGGNINGVYETVMEYKEQNHFTIGNDDVSLNLILTNLNENIITTSLGSISYFKDSYSENCTFVSNINYKSEYGSARLKIGDTTYSGKVAFVMEGWIHYEKKGNSIWYKFGQIINGEIEFKDGTKVLFVINSYMENSSYSFSFDIQRIYMDNNLIEIASQETIINKFDKEEITYECTASKGDFIFKKVLF